MTISNACRFRPIRHTAHIACQVVRERDFRLIADRIVNLSPNGMLVAPADPVLTGERLIVSFQSPNGEWIDTEASVARVAHGRRPGEFRRELGLEFVDLDAWSRAVLTASLRRIPPVPPRTRRKWFNGRGLVAQKADGVAPATVH